MDLKTIQTVEISGGIGILTLNRPDRRNAISIEMRLEILECMRKWKESQTVGVMIITGSGDAFSAGFDLTEFNHPERFSEIFDTSSRYHRELWNFPKPTIASASARPRPSSATPRSSSASRRWSRHCAGSSGKGWPGTFASRAGGSRPWRPAESGWSARLSRGRSSSSGR